MKLSYGIPKIDNISLEKFDYYIKSLSEMGYEGVEFSLCHPKRLNQESLKEILEKYKIEVSGLRSGGILSDAEGSKLRFSSPDPEIRAATVERMKEVIDFAAFLNCPVLMGNIQGELGSGETLEQAQVYIIECMCESANYAEKYNVKILLEPINHFQISYHNTVREMMSLLDRVNEKVSNKVLILLDVYHMWSDESSVSAAIVRARGRFAHVHFGGIRREVPGSGCMDFPEYIKILDALDYDGWVAMEVFYTEDLFETTARLSYGYVKPLMDTVKLAK